MTLQSTAIRLDANTALSAGAKLLVWIMAGVMGLSAVIIPILLDSRISAATSPLAEGLGVVRMQTQAIGSKVDSIITKDAQDDGEAQKTRERVALLEQLAVNGRAERLAFQNKVDQNFEKLAAQNLEVLRAITTLQAQQTMQRQKP